MKINLEKGWFIKEFYQMFCLILLIVDFDIIIQLLMNQNLKLKPDEGNILSNDNNDNNDIKNCLDSEKENEN